MSKEIDWSKALEGYPIWIEDLKPHIWSDMSGWHKEEEDRYVDEDGGFWNKPEDGFYRVYRNPNELWTGTGLPPVGTVCEVLWNESRMEYLKTKVFGVNEHGQPIHRFDEGPKKFQYQADPMFTMTGVQVFRPIRTQAQIEAEERADAVKEMIKIAFEKSIDSYGELHVHTMAEILYDHGYRKTEAGK